MKKTIKLKLQLIIFIIIVIQLPFSIAVAQDGDVIQVISTDTENDFPNGLTFHMTVQSKRPITRIKFLSVPLPLGSLKAISSIKSHRHNY